MEKPKKQPTQERSGALFASIIESAARILPGMGYARSTTNKIAELAGVSIGSLYQYFPNKGAIFATLIERELAAHSAAVVEVLESSGDQPLSTIIDRVVTRTFPLFMSKKELVRELFLKAAPQLDKVKEILFARNLLIERLAALVAEKKKVPMDEAKKKVFVAVNAFMGIVQTCVMMESIPVVSDEIPHQISELLVGYLDRR